MDNSRGLLLFFFRFFSSVLAMKFAFTPVSFYHHVLIDQIFQLQFKIFKNNTDVY